MKPPRYILRESAFKQLVKNQPAVHFLEIGYGSGEILLTLAEMGYTGAGYDFSDEARYAAEGLLKGRNVSGISLLRSLDTERKFELILFFEVMGYFDDPKESLLQFKEMLNDGGRIIFSFTNKKNRGIAEKVTGEMKCFTRDEITRILSEAGFEVEQIWNYGFPLTNLMRPFLDGYFLLKKKLGKKRRQDIRGTRQGHFPNGKRHHPA